MLFDYKFPNSKMLSCTGMTTLPTAYLWVSKVIIDGAWRDIPAVNTTLLSGQLTEIIDSQGICEGNALWLRFPQYIGVLLNIVSHVYHMIHIVSYHIIWYS